MKKPKGIEATVALISTIIIALIIFIMIRYLDEKIAKSRDTSRLINIKEITKLIINYRIFQERNKYDHLIFDDKETTQKDIEFILSKEKLNPPQTKKGRSYWFFAKDNNFLILACAEIQKGTLISDGMGSRDGIMCTGNDKNKPTPEKDSLFWQGTIFKINP